jgi:hypothetical protein
MAKTKSPKKVSSKPCLAAAFFCETVIEDKKDGSMSAVRIVDTLTFIFDPSTPPDFPSETHKLPIPLSGLISFKTLGAPGEHTLRVAMESPSGKFDPAAVLEQKFVLPDAPQGGMNLVLKSVIHVANGGLFKLHVFLDDEEVTQMPLFVSIQRVEAPTTEPEIPPPTPPAKGSKHKPAK